VDRNDCPRQGRGQSFQVNIRFRRAKSLTAAQPVAGILATHLDQLIDVQITATTPALRAGLTALLNDPRLNTTGGSATANPPDALSVRLHVIADDARLIQLARDIARTGANEVVVALTDLAGAAAEFSRLNLRGWAVLPPGADGDDLVMAVILASRGHIVLPAADAESLLGEGSAPPEPLLDPLTPREQEVLELLVRGLPNKNIAQALKISESTAKYHVSSIYVKLGAASRADAVSRAARAGLVTL